MAAYEPSFESPAIAQGASLAREPAAALAAPPEADPDPLRTRETKNSKLLTDLGILRLNGRALLARINAERRKQQLKPINQFLIWDTAQKGLFLQVGARTKTFRVQFRLNDQWLTCSIGRFGELAPNAEPHRQNVEIAKAREIADRWRALAKDGIDPRNPTDHPSPSKLTYPHRGVLVLPDRRRF